MNTYTITFWDDTKNEDLEIHEMNRKRFTKREYDNVILTLFYFAAQSIDFRNIHAEIRCNGEEIFRIYCKTRTDGSNITAQMTFNDYILRDIVIAA